MTRLFDRAASLQVDTLTVSDLRFTFDVERTLRPTPNKATIRVYNLTEVHRTQLAALPSIPVSLSAGYADGTHLIFKGDLRNAPSDYVAPDWITTISGADGSVRRRTARTRRSFRPGTELSTVVQALADDLGVGPGNVVQAIASAGLAGASTTFASGTVLDGNAWAQLTALCASCELELSVQNGVLQVLPLGQALAGTSLVLQSDTGLVGTVTKDTRGRIKFKTLMIPDLFPGRLVEPRTRVISGGRYRLTKCVYKGDTHDDEWTVDCEAEPESTTPSPASRARLDQIRASMEQARQAAIVAQEVIRIAQGGGA